MAKLLIKPNDGDGQNPKQHITPESAGWKYVGFETYHLKKGDVLKKTTGSIKQPRIVFISLKIIIFSLFKMVGLCLNKFHV